jgi:multidrug resistance efflux pump
VIERLRWLIRGGGPPVFRWTVRLVLVALVILGGFIPWNYEIGGQCHLLPAREAGVRAQIVDEIVHVLVKEGDTVEEGQVIAELAVREEQAGVARATAELKHARARLKLLLTGARDEDRAIALQRVEMWKIQFNYYESELKRNQELLQEKAASISDVEKSLQSRDGAEAALVAAQEALKRTEEGPREEEIEAQRAEVERVEAELAHYTKQVELRHIRAPLTGRIVTKDVALRTGHAVQPGDLIAVVHDTQRLRAEVAADEAAAVRIRPGMLVKLRLNGTDGELLTGKVVHVADKAIEENQFDQEAFRSDRETRVEEVLSNENHMRIRVDVELDKSRAKLVPGMTGEARIVVAEDLLWRALWRPVLRFVRVDVWSWLP